MPCVHILVQSQKKSKTTTMTRSYRELRRILTFEERYEYLALRGTVGDSTFGYDRHINQRFYRSREWRHLRNEIIVRDNGCDLGIDGYEIHERIIIHHMNPMTASSIVESDDDILNPDHLISVTHNTHNAIHYGDKNLLPRVFVERTPGDTKLW